MTGKGRTIGTRARISLGVEDAADVIADVEHALESVPAA